VACVLLAATAQADKWAKPALGPSASGGPEVLFTFDDGPDPKTTGPILAALKAHGVQAVFFVAGWRIQSLKGKNALARRETARRLLEAGMLLGNHTVDHVQLCQLTREEAAHEIDENGRLLTELAGMPTTFFRIPYGARCRQIDELLHERGLEHLHWDLDPQEYLADSPEETQEYVFDRLKKLKGRAVLLLHDTRRITARALPGILEWIARENDRRVRAGEQPIRILSYADIVRERMAPGLLPLLDQGAQALRELAPDLGRQLLLPLAGEAHPRAAALTR
jgi:peptidoglycan/xylan/chitin deacetylase (PgdA/CDA1 family)